MIKNTANPWFEDLEITNFGLNAHSFQFVTSELYVVIIVIIYIYIIFFGHFLIIKFIFYRLTDI